MTLVREFNLYLNAGKSIPLVINVNQFDSGEQWAFTIYKEDGTQYIPSTGAIVGIKSDNLGIINSGTVDENGRVIITETQQMTASVGKAVFELTLDSGTHGTANFVVLVEEKPGNNADLSDSDISLIQEALNAVSPLPTGGTVGQVLTKTAQGSAWSDAGTPTQEQVAEAVSDWADENITVTTGIVIDQSLSVQGAAADAKKTGDEISDLKSALEQGSSLTSAIKSALLQIAQKVAYIDEDGQTYYNDLYDALYPPIVVTAITLNTNSLSFVTLNSTQQLTATTTPVGGAVTWSSSDTSVATVSQTGVVTSVAYGNATITATSGNVSATCSVAIAQVTLSSISAVYTQSGTVYDTDSLDSLKSDLVVTATWSNSSTSTVASADYTLSGTLSRGTSVITVSYGGKTTTFNVEVTSLLPVGYTALEYVWAKDNNTTTPIYLTTGVIPTANTSVKYKASRDAVPTDAGHIASTLNYYVPHWKLGVSGLTIFANRKGTEVSLDYLSADITLSADVPYEISAYMDGTDNVVLNGVTIGTVTAGNKNVTKQLTLFTYDGVTNVSGYAFAGKLYWMQFYESGTMIRNYLPCKNASNVVGLYDTVNDTFISSATANSLYEPE